MSKLLVNRKRLDARFTTLAPSQNPTFLSCPYNYTSHNVCYVTLEISRLSRLVVLTLPSAQRPSVDLHLIKVEIRSFLQFEADKSRVGAIEDNAQWLRLRIARIVR